MCSYTHIIIACFFLYIQEPPPAKINCLDDRTNRCLLRNIHSIMRSDTKLDFNWISDDPVSSWFTAATFGRVGCFIAGWKYVRRKTVRISRTRLERSHAHLAYFRFNCSRGIRTPRVVVTSLGFRDSVRLIIFFFC